MMDYKIKNICEEIISFIEYKYTIGSYYTEYYGSSKTIKIVFNYSFYILYNIDDKILIEVDYDENKVDITKDFNDFHISTGVRFAHK